MEYTRVPGFGSEWKKEKGASGASGALSGQDSDDGMDFGGDMGDMCSSGSSTLNNSLSSYGPGFHVPDGLQSTLEEEERKNEGIDEISETPGLNSQMEAKPSTSDDSHLEFPPLSLALGELPPLWEPWRFSWGDDLHTEELGSSNQGAVGEVPGSVSPEANRGISSPSEACELQKAAVVDGFCGIDMPCSNDQGLDGTFVSSFNRERPPVVSSTEPEVQMSLVDVGRPPSLLRERSAVPGGGERFPQRYEPFSFRFPMSLPEAPPNIGFSFSPRLGSIPNEEMAAYRNKSDQDKCGDSQSRRSKTAKHHQSRGTVSPENAPSGMPARMGRMAGETPPGGLWSVEPFHSGSESLAILGLDTTCLLCSSPNTPPRCHSSLDGNHTECCDQKLSEKVCSNMDRDQGGNREVGHWGRMARNTDMRVRGMEVTGAQGGLYGKSRVEDYPGSA